VTALGERFRVSGLVKNAYAPEVYLDHAAIECAGLPRAEVENAAARFLLAQPGIAEVFTRTRMEQGVASKSRLALLMQRAWHRELAGDPVLVTEPYSFFGNGGADSGTTHGTPCDYDTNVPLLLMGKPWIRPGAVAQYAEVVDIAPALAHILHVRPPAAAEGRVLTEALR